MPFRIGNNARPLIGALVQSAHAEEYQFHPDLSGPISFNFVPDDYKATRVKEISEMMKAYDGLYDHRELLIAHLLRECGSITETCGWKPGKASNDHGWAIGIAQWHLVYRERPWLLQNNLVKIVGKRYTPLKPIATIREMFFASHPEMTTWQGQTKRYLQEMSYCLNDKTNNRTIEFCVDSWNANPSYMSQVRAQLPEARRLLTTI